MISVTNGVRTTYSVFRGVSYGNDIHINEADDEHHYVDGYALASSAFTGFVNDDTFELGAITDIENLPLAPHAADIIEMLNPYFEEFPSEVNIERVISVVFLIKKLVTGNPDHSTQRVLFNVRDYENEELPAEVNEID